MRKIKPILGIASIIFGGIIYIVWRKQTLLMFNWFDLIGLSSIVDSIRNITKAMFVIPPEWFRFSLPNALWLFGGILLFSSIWGKWSFERLSWIVVFLSIAIGSEFMQLVGYIPGIYDNCDMFFMIVFALLALLIDTKKTTKEVIDAKG
jgi:hypothetical protein